MIRFIKNILDVKNLLGKLRSVPASNSIVFTTAMQDPAIRISGTGDIVIRSNSGGSPVQSTYTNPVLALVNISADAGTQVELLGDVTAVYFTDGIGCDISDLSLNTDVLERLALTNQSLQEVVVNANLRELDINYCANLTHLDISAAPGLQNFGQTGNPAITLIRARTSISMVAIEIGQMITYSSGTGTVYVPTADPYYSIIATAASNKGWTIEEL